MVKFIKFGSVAGVLAPGYANRTDLEKFDLALRAGSNWFVSYTGGLISRPGEEFLDYIKEDDKTVVTFPFQYGFDVANTYLVLFGHNYIRFVQDGAYVLEATKTITSAAGAVATSNAHGYEVGDWLKLINMSNAALNGLTVVVSAKTTNTVTLTTVFGDALDFTGFTSGSFARIYTLTSPIGATRLDAIRVHQIRDTLRITSLDRDFLPYNLTRTSSTSWTITAVEFSNDAETPTNLSGVGSDPGSGATWFTVTSVNEDGEESLPAVPFRLDGIENYAYTAGWATFTWDAVDNARYYNVYRSLVGNTLQMTSAQEMGFIGKAYGPVFHDFNVIPDFTKQPPISRNPFADSTIKFINVTAGGSGYLQSSTVTVTDGSGSGFVGYPVIDSGGAVVAVVVVNGGAGYASPSVSVSDGTGATFAVELGEVDGNIPSIGAVFQQRQVYASTDNAPLTLEGGRPGQLNNFDISNTVTDGDAYSFDIDNDIVSYITWLLPTRSGLLIGSPAGMWQLTGSGGGPVTPTDALVERQSFLGTSNIGPLQINEDIAVLDVEGTSVRMLAYSDFYKNYASTDITILSNHFFKNDNQAVSWAFFNSPHRLIVMCREDGSIIAGCVVKEHQIFGWTDWYTQGDFLRITKVREDTIDRMYTITRRLVNGVYKKYLGRFATRTVGNVEDFIGLDAALTLATTTPAATVSISANTGEVTVLANAAVFSAGDVGKVFRGGGGRGTVTAFNSTTSITVDLDTPITVLVHGSSTKPRQIASGKWTLDAKVSTIYGLEHLEGLTVTALLDGAVYKDQVVENGQLTFDIEFSRAVVGLPFTCVAAALTPSAAKDVIEDKRKRVTEVAVWLHETRGIEVGTRLSKMYEAKERSVEDYNIMPELRSGLTFVSVDPVWEETGLFYIRQDNPLPASLLGWIVSMELGDDDPSD